eukprot:COSAG01_NODE_166_length_23296_cov_140.506014_13_plen_119_part_00
MQVPVAMTLPTPYLWQREVYAAWTWLIQSTPCLLLLTAHLLLGEAYRPHLPLPCGLCGFIYGRGNHLCPPPRLSTTFCASLRCNTVISVITRNYALLRVTLRNRGVTVRNATITRITP